MLVGLTAGSQGRERLCVHSYTLTSGLEIENRTSPGLSPHPPVIDDTFSRRGETTSAAARAPPIDARSRHPVNLGAARSACRRQRLEWTSRLLKEVRFT